MRERDEGVHRLFENESWENERENMGFSGSEDTFVSLTLDSELRSYKNHHYPRFLGDHNRRSPRSSSRHSPIFLQEKKELRRRKRGTQETA